MQTDKINPLKVTVEANRHILGRLMKNSFTAHLGETGWNATGTCKQGALDLLFADLKAAEENQVNRKYIVKGGVTFALYYARGWCYDIVRADGSYSVCCLLSNSFGDAVEKMARHAEQHDGI